MRAWLQLLAMEAGGIFADLSLLDKKAYVVWAMPMTWDQDVGGICRIDYRPVAWISPYA